MGWGHLLGELGEGPLMGRAAFDAVAAPSIGLPVEGDGQGVTLG